MVQEGECSSLLPPYTPPASVGTSCLPPASASCLVFLPPYAPPASLHPSACLEVHVPGASVLGTCSWHSLCVLGRFDRSFEPPLPRCLHSTTTSSLLSML